MYIVAPQGVVATSARLKGLRNFTGVAVNIRMRGGTCQVRQGSHYSDSGLLVDGVDNRNSDVTFDSDICH